MGASGDVRRGVKDEHPLVPETIGSTDLDYSLFFIMPPEDRNLSFHHDVERFIEHALHRDNILGSKEIMLNDTSCEDDEGRGGV
eukprot:CAMPEP_0185793256 /NCGR_PEP_ID=MMETSP1174-20130828/159374_1 /TAXON_ID=35687 /ORGANISM="Dictyocha speculum, Strain CCMP1381" /LENGTH=83 /DNA_ID=CAMNT_0028488385 /DNA_START=1192 /DNA_END=1443 /DNA_ORIENTATION=+